MVQVQGAEELKSYVYLGMVTKLAWKTWQQLPVHTRTWISIEDMVLDGLRWVEMAGLSRWNQQRGSLMTILYVGVSNYYFDHYLVRFTITKRSREQRVISIQDKEQEAREQGKEFEFERALGIRTKSQGEVEQQFINCLAGEKMVRLYRTAGTKMQKNMRDWFFKYAIWHEGAQDPDKYIRWRTKTKSFQDAAAAFRGIALPQGITIRECRHLLNNPICLDRMSRDLTGLPYEWAAPVSHEGGSVCR